MGNSLQMTWKICKPYLTDSLISTHQTKMQTIPKGLRKNIIIITITITSIITIVNNSSNSASNTISNALNKLVIVTPTQFSYRFVAAIWKKHCNRFWDAWMNDCKLYVSCSIQWLQYFSSFRSLFIFIQSCSVDSDWKCMALLLLLLLQLLFLFFDSSLSRIPLVC